MQSVHVFSNADQVGQHFNLRPNFKYKNGVTIP